MNFYIILIKYFAILFAFHRLLAFISARREERRREKKVEGRTNSILLRILHVGKEDYE